MNFLLALHLAVVGPSVASAPSKPQSRPSASTRSSEDDSAYDDYEPADGGVQLYQFRDASIERKRTGPSTHAWIPASIGAAMLAGGGVTWFLARHQHDALQAGDPDITTREQFDAAVRRGKTLQTVSLTLTGLGVAGLATGLTMALLGGHEQRAEKGTSVSLVPTAQGAAFSFAGRF